MPGSTLFAMMLMVVAGALVSVQAPMNAALGKGMGSPVAAAAVSFVIGLVALLIIAVAIGDAPAFAKITNVSPWLLLGGLLGAVYVFSSLWAVPMLGVATTIILVILGQLVMALFLDYFGAFGIEPREISLPRLLGAVLVAGGAILSRF